jgi:hypothetical protein
VKFKIGLACKDLRRMRHEHQCNFRTIAGSSNPLPGNSPAAYNRDYYEVALADGAVYRIYCDLTKG